MVSHHTKAIKSVEEKFGDRFSYLSDDHMNNVNLPRFKDLNTGIVFIYIPRGEYTMGFSEEEYIQIQKLTETPNISIEEMRPVRKVQLRPFLLSITPVLNCHILNYNYLLGKSIKVDGDDYSPFFCDYALAESIATNLSSKIPNEEEWEYACRGGKHSLFCFGNTLPTESELEKWLSWDLSSLTDLNCNDFGLYGLYFGEWCSNDFTVNLELNSDTVSGSKAVRGGGALFFPWQDEEWVYCLSAFRMPSKDLLGDQAAFRLKMEI